MNAKQNFVLCLLLVLLGAAVIVYGINSWRAVETRKIDARSQVDRRFDRCLDSDHWADC